MAEEKRLPNLMLPEFREVDFLENEYDMEIFVEPTIDTRRVVCPHCGSAIVSVHANDERFFRDINMYEKRVGVSVNGKRYKCSYCKKTFVLQYNSVEPDGKISNRLKEALQKKALNHTFTSVAEEYGLSEKTVERVFSDYSEILNLRPDVKAPRVLGIDECHLQKQMRPVYVDIEAATILEMGKSVKKVDNAIILRGIKITVYTFTKVFYINASPHIVSPPLRFLISIYGKDSVIFKTQKEHPNFEVSNFVSILLPCKIYFQITHAESRRTRH